MKTVIRNSCLIILLLFTGCVTLYKPNVINSPLLKEKGEGSATASLGVSGTGWANIQGAYAVSDHIGLMLNGMYHSRRTTTEGTNSSTEKLNIAFGEAGLGYFNQSGSNKNILFQLYGGGGYGATHDIITGGSSQNPEISSKYTNIFVQPGFALIGKLISASFDLRANYVHLYDVHAYMFDQFEFWNTDYIWASDSTLSFMNLEPTVTVRIGEGNLKGLIQFGATVPTINSKSYFAIDSYSMLLFPLLKFSAGICYTFGEKKK
jgi:hypothetical protein